MCVIPFNLNIYIGSTFTSFGVCFKKNKNHQNISQNNGINVEYTDTSTADIGSTSSISFTVTLVGGNVRLNAIITAGTWEVKSANRFI